MWQGVKKTNYAEICREEGGRVGGVGNAEKSIYYAENTRDYVEISTVNKISDNKAFPMHPPTVKQKALQTLTYSF